MVSQVYCERCKDRFYGDDEKDLVSDRYYCSYCMPFIRECGICGKSIIMQKQNTSGQQFCDECKIEYSGSRIWNGWLFLRFATLQRDGFTCRYCGRSPLKDKDVVLECDHLHPRSRGGEDTIENLVTACRECNMGKIDVLLNNYNIQQIKTREAFKNGTAKDYLTTKGTRDDQVEDS